MSDNVIRVPKPSKASYNPNRPLEKNQLLQAQVKHMHAVEEQLPPELRSGVDLSMIRTEGQAASYVRRVTRLIHGQADGAKLKRESPK